MARPRTRSINIPDSCGVYMLRAVSNPEWYYIGSSKNVRRRSIDHLYNLQHHTHPNINMQEYYNENGEGSISFIILELCDIKILVDREQYYLIELCPIWNTNFVAAMEESNVFGKKLTRESNRAIIYSEKDVLQLCDRELFPETIISLKL